MMHICGVFWDLGGASIHTTLIRNAHENYVSNGPTAMLRYPTTYRSVPYKFASLYATDQFIY